MAEQQYMTPKPYFVLDASSTKELQREAGDLRTEVDAAGTSWLNRTRSAERLKDVERQLQTKRMADRQGEVRQVQQVQQRQRLGTAREMILSDNGEVYLVVGNAAAKPSPSPAQSYMKPVAY